jgi:hypothetical protein
VVLIGIAQERASVWRSWPAKARRRPRIRTWSGVVRWRSSSTYLWGTPPSRGNGSALLLSALARWTAAGVKLERPQRKRGRTSLTPARTGACLAPRRRAGAESVHDRRLLSSRGRVAAGVSPCLPPGAQTYLGARRPFGFGHMMIYGVTPRAGAAAAHSSKAVRDRARRRWYHRSWSQHRCRQGGYHGRGVGQPTGAMASSPSSRRV